VVDVECKQFEVVQFFPSLQFNYFSQATPELLLFSMSKSEVYSFVWNDMEHCLTLLDSSVEDWEVSFS
jgi:hypothetical protein